MAWLVELPQPATNTWIVLYIPGSSSVVGYFGPTLNWYEYCSRFVEVNCQNLSDYWLLVCHFHFERGQSEWWYSTVLSRYCLLNQLSHSYFVYYAFYCDHTCWLYIIYFFQMQDWYYLHFYSSINYYLEFKYHNYLTSYVGPKSN